MRTSKRHSSGAAFFACAVVAVVLLFISFAGVDAMASDKPLPNAPQDARPEPVEIIRNADGSVTIPADQLDKMAGYFGALGEQNLALKRAVIEAYKRVEKLEKRRCS